MSLENDVGQEAGSAEVAISKADKKRVRRLVRYFRAKNSQKDGKEGVEGIYHSLFLFRRAMLSGLVNSNNFAEYQAVLNGEIPFYVQKGMVLSREYYFDRQKEKGYRTKTRFFSSPTEAFNPLDVDD